MRKFVTLLLLCALLICCNDDDPAKTGSSTPDWTEATHGNDADPDYEIVFPQQKVNEIEITMTAETWTSLQQNMNETIGFAFGSRPQGNPGFTSEEPDYFPVSLKHDGKEWYKVGFRLKGNSTLKRTWGDGTYKLPFRLQFDEFENDYPEIDDQRFYGFKEVSMSPGVMDNSLIREKLAADLFRQVGVAAARTAFYKVYIDFGAGKQYCGVYTMIEIVDDTMVDDQFGNDDGNIYKPESRLISFNQQQFEKKNNEEENDFTDIKNFISVLNSPLRTSDPTQWRNSLEANFDVHRFLKYLAANTTMVNWDTYGAMAHNYYLYNDAQQKLTWIPWDHNEALQIRNIQNQMTDISLSGVSAEWPLIRFLLDDPLYSQIYRQYLRDFSDNVFSVANTSALFEQYHNLIAPYVVGPEAVEQGKYTNLQSPSAFNSSVNDLKNHVTIRRQAVEDYLD
jgi:spore coat protein H